MQASWRLSSAALAASTRLETSELSTSILMRCYSSISSFLGLRSQSPRTILICILPLGCCVESACCKLHGEVLGRRFARSNFRPCLTILWTFSGYDLCFCSCIHSIYNSDIGSSDLVKIVRAELTAVLAAAGRLSPAKPPQFSAFGIAITFNWRNHFCKVR